MATEVPPSGVLERYRFDTVFDGGGDVIASNPRPKRTYTSDEVEQIRRAAEAQGQAQALAGVAARQSDALNAIARACQQALPRLAAVAHEHREGSAELSLACAQAIADGIRQVCAELRARSPRTRILLLAVFPRDRRRNPERRRTQELNRILAGFDGRDGITFLDLGSVFLRPDGSIPRTLMADYLHPTPLGYNLWAAAMEPTLRRLLDEPD